MSTKATIEYNNAVRPATAPGGVGVGACSGNICLDTTRQNLVGPKATCDRHVSIFDVAPVRDKYRAPDAINSEPPRIADKRSTAAATSPDSHS